MKLVKIVLAPVVVITIIIASLYFYYIYTPSYTKPVLTGNYLNQQISHDGLKRKYSIYIPKLLPDQSPVVFVLHGSASNSNQVRTWTTNEFEQLADQRGFIVVFPNGFDHHWNDCRASADYKANQQGIDDVGFLSEVIQQLVSDYMINPAKAYVTGFSNGGHMVYRLALEAPMLFAAYAPIAANLPVDENLGCTKRGQPVSMAIFNGTNDPINPYEGGLVSVLGNKSRGMVLSSKKTFQYWLGLADPSAQSASVTQVANSQHDKTNIILQRYQNSKVDIRLYTLKDSGHVIPSLRRSFPRLLGGNNSGLSAPSEIIDFFMAQHGAQAPKRYKSD